MQASQGLRRGGKGPHLASAVGALTHGATQSARRQHLHRRHLHDKHLCTPDAQASTHFLQTLSSTFNDDEYQLTRHCTSTDTLCTTRVEPAEWRSAASGAHRHGQLWHNTATFSLPGALNMQINACTVAQCSKRGTPCWTALALTLHLCKLLKSLFLLTSKTV